jgi:hypothetical protein
MYSKKTIWRHLNPDKYEEEKKKERIRLREYYANNEERREKVKKTALERYYRLKAEKQAIAVQAS